MDITYSDIYDKTSVYNAKVTINEIEHCPICKYAIKPIKLHGEIYNDNSDKTKLSIMYYCNHCYKSFIVQYSKNKYASTINYNYDYSAPNIYTKEIFDDCINNISPTFVKIYNQASEAEHSNLDEIAGIGYRKALEFLIKDFLIEQYPEKADNIKVTPLGNCVNNFIDNPQLKTVASRAVWLGNDQTHYIQKFEYKDINDLKRLIKLTINWITMLYLTNEAENIEKP